MAEFIIGSPLRKLAREHRFLRDALWRLDFIFVWSLVKMARLLPIDAASRYGQRVGIWVGARLKRKTVIFKENMRTAFPEKSEQEITTLVQQSWGRVGRVLAEYPHLDRILRDPDRLLIEISEPIATYSDPTQPCVVVSAHLSNWEVICSALAKMGIPNASLYSPPTNPLLDKMLLEHREALNCELLPRDNSARGLVRAMKAGRSAGMVIDRRVDEGTPIHFFGKDKVSTTMPARLAMKFNCDLVPVQVERLRDAHYRITFHPPVKPHANCQDDEARAIDMMQQIHQQFETWIRAQPQDWFCSKRLWPKQTTPKTKPSEEAGDDAEIDSYAA